MAPDLRKAFIRDRNVLNSLADFAKIVIDQAIATVQANTAERAREAEELRQQLSSGPQHAEALSAARSRQLELEQQIDQLKAALQQEASNAQTTLEVRMPKNLQSGF